MFGLHTVLLLQRVKEVVLKQIHNFVYSSIIVWQI